MPLLTIMQLILQRRAELKRNKAKYALTEVDAQLLGTHSTEVRFADGQTIVEENNDITCIYRIRSGKVVVSRHGFQYHIISKVCEGIGFSFLSFVNLFVAQGWFIGDAVLIYDSPAYTMKGTMIAQGPVILDQLNLAFVRNLFAVDTVSSLKRSRRKE
jgi:hypothetical protein